MSVKRIFSPAKTGLWSGIGAFFSGASGRFLLGGLSAREGDSAPVGSLPGAAMRNILRTSWKMKSRSSLSLKSLRH
jgi:hypothetical protein